MMNVKQYDPQTQALVDRSMEEISVLSPKVMGTLKKLVRRGKELQDDVLLAFAYYYQAQYLYYRDCHKEAYRSAFQKAFSHALKADYQALLSRIYSFVAADALNNGCFDIAFNNYITAMNISARLGDQATIALIEANVGRLYAELRDYKEARKYLRRGIAKQKKLKKSLRYIQNTTIMLAGDALASLNMGDVTAAEKTIGEMLRIYDQGSPEVQAELFLSRTYLLIRLALEKGDDGETDRLLKQFLEALRKEQQVQDLVEDINGLYYILMEKGRRQDAGDLLDAVDEGMMQTNVAYVMCAFCELKADYCRAVGDSRNLSEILRTHMELGARLRSEQRDMYSHAVTLTHIIENLREERQRVEEENRALTRQAQTDALTGIPNRYQLNEALDQAFKKVEGKNQNLAISILDIDYFKEFNDNYGHREGDSCLIRIARTLDKIAQKHGGFCARYGGDEFVMVFTDLSDEALLEMVQEVQSQVEALGIAHAFQPRNKTVTLAQGICNDIPTGPSSPWDFLSAADGALYYIKKNRGKISPPETYAITRYSE